MKLPFKKQKLSYSFLELFKGVEKALLVFFNLLTVQTEKTGKSDAESPPPDGTAIAVLPYVDQIKKACEGRMSKIYTDLSGALETVLTEFNFLYDRIQSYLKTIQEKIDVLKAQKKSALGNVLKHFEDKTLALSERIKDKKSHLKTLVIAFNDMKRVSLFWGCFVAIILNIIFTVGDMAYIAKSFSLVGLNFYEQYLIAIILGISNGAVAAGVVEIFRSEWNTLKKAIGITLLVAIIFSLFIFIGQLRVDLVAKNNVSGTTFSEISAAGFALTNAIIFCAIIVVHAIAWPNKAKWEAYHNFKNAKKDVSEAEKSIKKDEKTLENIPEELAKKQALISEKYDKTISKLTDEQKSHIDDLESRQATYNNMLTSMSQFHTQINSFFRQTVSQYIGVLNKFNHNGSFIVMDDSLEDIPNPFSKYHVLESSLPEVIQKENFLALDYPTIDIDFEELITDTKTIKNETITENN